MMTPGGPHTRRKDRMSVGTVQQWVLSLLAATTIMHMAIGLVIAAAYVDGTGRQVGLLVLATAFGVLAIFSALAIHQVRLLSWWLVVGLLPPALGAWVIFG